MLLIVCFHFLRSSKSPVRNIQNDSPVKSNRKNNKKRILDDSSDKDVGNNKENGVAQNREETKVADSSSSNDQGAPPKRKTGLSSIEGYLLQSFKISNIDHTNSRTSFYNTFYVLYRLKIVNRSLSQNKKADM